MPSSRQAGLDPVRAFGELPTTQRVLQSAVRRGRHRGVGGLWGASAALLLAVLRRQRPGPMLVLCADDGDAAALVDDLQSFVTTPITHLVAQAQDVDGGLDPATRRQRLRALEAVAGHRGEDWLLVGGVHALIQPAPDASLLARDRLEVEVGQTLRREEVMAAALRHGLRQVPVVTGPGEVSLRGDVVDLFPLAAADAWRLEFFDDEVESIRAFDPGTQTSLATRDAASIPLAGEGDAEEGKPVFEQLFEPDLLFVRHEPLRIEERMSALRALGQKAARLHQRMEERHAGCAQLALSSLPSEDLDYKILSAGGAAGSGEADPRGRIAAIRGIQGALQIWCRSDTERDRLAEIFAHRDIDLVRERVTLHVGGLSRGFSVPDLGLTLVSNTEFAGVAAAPRVVREQPSLPTRAVASFFELGPGDIVVHAVHGIAVFEGIERVERQETSEDHLRLSFADEVKLLVPVSKVHLVQKYIGTGGAAAIKLDKLGGKGFARRKAEVSEALFDLAADLLELQAKRARIERPPCPPDELEEAFLDGFPYRDTPDQERTWREVGLDLQKPSPMDRLVCGDVGFGKTEIALRAAFRMAITGRQVAVLVPTTVLAEQHGKTFAARFEPLGLRVEVISRFRPARERKEVLADVVAGRVDVLIGTHRLLSKDVAWHRLGMLVIDEEQRFGVRHKEQLKQHRVEVDVLTLSATPIPRTLHAGLVGIRDISTLTTPPPGRQDVETRVAWNDERLVGEAVARELGRGGQVFVLHNRIEDLELWQRLIERLVPGARVAIGHGKMTETQMEKTVRRFVAGDVDVLVSTTIVENGLDIPRANTILIDRADHFGLAELHQLRGRVGRSATKAYCYLLMDRAKPPKPDGKKRLKALEEFSQLGAGFAIAMKDLEIRGAGNLLGPQQSGHIAAVGYEMYCQLLEQAVAAAKDRRAVDPSAVEEVDVDLRVDAYLPDAFLPDAKARLELLREMDGAVDTGSALALEQGLSDRFGSLPRPVRNLLRIFLLKHLLADQGVRGVQLVEEDRVVVRHPAGRPLGGAWLEAFRAVRPVEAGKTHLMLPARRKGKGPLGEAVLGFLLEALLGPAAGELPAAWRGEERRRKGRRRAGRGDA